MSLLALKLMAAGASGEPAGSAKNIERYAFLGSPVNRMSWQSYWNDKTLLNRRSISDPWGNSQIGGQRVRQFYIREGNNDASIDGKSIYFLDSDSDKLVTLTLGVPYDLNTIIANNYNSGASDFTGIDNQMFYGLWWKPDGARYYMIGRQNGKVYERIVSGSAWTTSSSAGGTFTFSQNSYPIGITFKPDGTKFFVGRENSNSSAADNRIQEYSLSSAWDLTSTISYVGESPSDGQFGQMLGMAMNFDGTKFYKLTQSSILTYNLSSAYTLSTASYSSSDSISISTKSGDLWGGMWIGGPGAVVGGGNSLFLSTQEISSPPAAAGVGFDRGLVKLDLDTDNDITASSSNLIYSSTKHGKLQSFAGDPFMSGYVSYNGQYVYTLSRGNAVNTNGYVRRYTMSTPHDLTTLAQNQDSNQSEQTADDDASALWFKPDGTRYFVTGKDHNRMHVWDCSTPFDLTTASQNSGAEISLPSGGGYYGLVWSPSGNHFYYTNGSVSIYHRKCTTPWDPSTSSAQSTANFNSGTANVSKFYSSPKIMTMAISSDGYRVYTVQVRVGSIQGISSGGGYNFTSLAEWTLATPFDTNSARELKYERGMTRYGAGLSMNFAGLTNDLLDLTKLYYFAYEPSSGGEVNTGTTQRPGLYLFDHQEATYTVTVQSVGGNNKYFINHLQQANVPGVETFTYIFDWTAAGASHPLRFSTTSDGTHGGGSEYTTGVTIDTGNKKSTITIASSAPILYYYCENHSGMGGTLTTNSA
jgi:hypothetical protein